MSNGLSAREAATRLARDGPNALPEPVAVPIWRRLIVQFRSPLVLLLVAALGVDVALWAVGGARGWPVDAVAIALILALNAVLGLVQERRSEAAIARLKNLAAAQAWTLRDGQFVRVPTAELVTGDVVRVDAGDRVPADGHLDRAEGVLADESMLTGESVPVDKVVGDEALSGTVVVRGTARLTIVRTGAASAMGRLAGMLGEIAVSQTPLERRVDRLGRSLARWVIGLAAVLGAAGVAVEGLARVPQMLFFAIALAVAAVPEGLPAVLTVAMALGVERMARHRAVVRRLSAVEALGSVTVIATDKTGTLTENRMEVRDLDALDDAEALRALVLANDADPATGAGDPLDAGLLRYAAAHGVDAAATRAASPVVSAQPFDSETKLARTTVRSGTGMISYVKGAPEMILSRSTLGADERRTWEQKADAQAREGFRLIALAKADGEQSEHLTFLGLACLWDPPRPEVAAAVSRAKEAGIRVMMITGDHPATATAIAGLVGLPDARTLTGADLDRVPSGDRARTLADVHVFARVTPEQKLRLVESLQAQGQVVAMTGDGVNDAPALKRSDVGVAMGERGSDVSREVADLVLLDDNFATIVRAIEEGRGIYGNIQSFLRFLFSTNLSELLVVVGGAAVAYAAGQRDPDGMITLPLTAAQILWINLVTDGVPALALAFDRTPGVMRDPPRPRDAPLLDGPSARFVIGAGALKALLALGILVALPRFGADLPAARATMFHYMAIGQLLLTYPARWTRVAPDANPWLHAAVVSGIAVQIAVATIPATSRLLGGVTLPWTAWGVVFGAAATAWAMAASVAWVVWRGKGRR